MDKKEGKNFSKSVQMHLACAKDDIRLEMCCIYFKGIYAYATDAVILVRNSLLEMSNFDEADIQALDGKYLPADFYKEIIKYDDCLISEEGIECHKGDDKAFFYFKEFEGGKYPNVDAVLETAMNMATVPLPQIAFDIKNLQRLHKALFGSEKCKATFKGTDKPIVFYSLEPTVTSIGILMPAYLDE